MKIGIIGHFGGKKTFNDGQTIKTKTLYEALIRKNFDVLKVDTYYIKHNPIIFLWKFFISLFSTKKYIILLSSNGRRVMFPIMYVCIKIFKKEIYHYAIGGRLARELNEYPKWKKYVSSFNGNWMESRKLVGLVNDEGILNAKYIPNFKSLIPLNSSELGFTKAEEFTFCIFSRVMKEKGVEDAIQACAEINKKYRTVICKLDIYGQVEDNFASQFHDLINENQFCRYCGVVNPNESVKYLKDYYMLLFPTHWKHEGMPGTIIDALAAGLPIIARRWQYCDEMIDDGITGLVYEFENPELLVTKLDYAINNQEHVFSMRKNCIEKSQEYCEKYAIEGIIQELGL